MASIIGLKTRASDKDVGRSAASISKSLANFGNKYEMKTFIPTPASGGSGGDVPQIVFQTTPTSNLLGMFNIGNGTGDGQRIGRLVTVKEVCLTGIFYVENNGDANFASPLVRVIVGIDRQHNGRNMVDADDVLLKEVIPPVPPAVTPTYTGPFWYSMMDLGQEKRLKILADNTFEMTCTGTFPGSDKFCTAILNYSKTFKMHLPVEYSLQDGPDFDPNDNLVQTNDFFVHITTSRAGVQYFMEGRVRYMDDC